jgi:hypothetical protein
VPRWVCHGGEGREHSGAVPCQEGGEPVESSFHHRLPVPGTPARIAFSVRISKAAPGLFWSGNLSLRWVYFSTLENSQCRTRSQAAPSLLSPPLSLPPRGRRGGVPHSWPGLSHPPPGSPARGLLTPRRDSREGAEGGARPSAGRTMTSGR